MVLTCGKQRDFRKSHQSSQGPLLKKQWWIGAECCWEGSEKWSSQPVIASVTLGCRQAREQGLGFASWALAHMDTIWQAVPESFQSSLRNRIQEEMAASPSMSAISPWTWKMLQISWTNYIFSQTKDSESSPYSRVSMLLELNCGFISEKGSCFFFFHFFLV